MSVEDDFMQDYRIGITEGWVDVPLDPDVDPAWVHDAAAQVTSTPQAADTFVAAVLKVRPAFVDGDWLRLVVWVPDPAEGGLAGMMMVVRIVGDDEDEVVTRDLYRSIIDPDPRRGVVVYGRTIDEVDLPAGPALLVREVMSQRRQRWFPWARIIEHHTIYTVFPPGCADALEVLFTTFEADLSDELAEHARASAESLIIVGPTPS